MCSTPTIVSCTSPSQLTPTSDDKIHGFVQQLHDFTHGIGSGVFLGMQRYLHKLNMEYGALREPVVQEITALAIHHAATTGKFNSFYSLYNLARLKWEIGGALIPFFLVIGGSWSVVTGILVAIAIFKIILGMILHAVATYRQRGCGWWLLASLFHTAFLTLMLPVRIISSITHELTDDIPKGPGDRTSNNGLHQRVRPRERRDRGDDEDDQKPGQASTSTAQIGDNLGSNNYRGLFLNRNIDTLSASDSELPPPMSQLQMLTDLIQRP